VLQEVTLTQLASYFLLSHVGIKDRTHWARLFQQYLPSIGTGATSALVRADSEAGRRGAGRAVSPACCRQPALRSTDARTTSSAHRATKGQRPPAGEQHP